MRNNLRHPAIVMLMTASVLSSAAITLPDLPDREGMAIKGYVHDGTQPMAGVYVTDGYSFATTDADGSYYIPATPGAEMVYVITPSGYNPSCANGLSRFWVAIDPAKEITRADFTLTATGDDTAHKMVVLGDPQMKDDHDHAIFKADALPDIKATLQSIKDEGSNVGMLVLGDMCFNNPETYPRYSAYWIGVNTPMYHVPGNHDKHIVPEADAQSQEYKALFGPLYYSFNKGKVHYLMLDNIFVAGTDAYGAYLDQAQLDWVMKDLDHVEEGSRVVVCAHQPMSWTVTSRQQNQKLLERLNKYNTLMLTAHKHLGWNLDKYYSNIEERIQTALCGAYWFGDVAKDGIDLGYYIYNIDGDNIDWEFKPLKRASDASLRINDPVRNADGSYTFLANMFDWDTNWSVNYRVDGVDMGAPKQVEQYDPYAEKLYANHVKTWCRPVATKHLFEITVAAEARTLEVSGTDRFGHSVNAIYHIMPTEIEDRDGMTVKGFVRCDGMPVEGVAVTNGYDFATTNIFGIYYLPQNDKAEMVYIVTPAGYDPLTTDGMPGFFQHIVECDGAFQADFNLTATGDDTRHHFVAVGDPQMRDDHDYTLFETIALPDLKSTFESLSADGTPCATLILGDICFNTPETYPRYTKSLAGIRTPFYHVPGNHDKQIVTIPGVAERDYKATFGPLYYSFNKGSVHYLMLDNIYITSAGAYDTAISDDAAAWVTKDLAMVPQGSTVVVCVHQPITSVKATAEANKDLLVGLSKYRTLILSAHKHYGQNLGKYSLSAAANADIEERIQSALCGAYWFGDVAKDGTPLGYYVYDVDGSDISWQFKPLGDDDYTQITIHQPAPFGSKLKVDANIYDYDSNWSVTWKLDGVSKGRMYNYETLDPRANELYAEHEKSWCRPTLTKHMFYGYLTTDYSEIEVSATDRFGRTHTRTFSAEAGLGSITSSNLHVSLDGRLLHVASEHAIDTIQIYTLSGAVCASCSGNSDMDLSALPAGSYVARIAVADGGHIVEKIILR